MLKKLSDRLSPQRPNDVAPDDEAPDKKTKALTNASSLLEQAFRELEAENSEDISSYTAYKLTEFIFKHSLGYYFFEKHQQKLEELLIKSKLFREICHYRLSSNNSFVQLPIPSNVIAVFDQVKTELTKQNIDKDETKLFEIIHKVVEMQEHSVRIDALLEDSTAEYFMDNFWYPFIGNLSRRVNRYDPDLQNWLNEMEILFAEKPDLLDQIMAATQGLKFSNEPEDLLDSKQGPIWLVLKLALKTYGLYLASTTRITRQDFYLLPSRLLGDIELALTLHVKKNTDPQTEFVTLNTAQFLNQAWKQNNLIVPEQNLVQIVTLNLKDFQKKLGNKQDKWSLKTELENIISYLEHFLGADVLKQPEVAKLINTIESEIKKMPEPKPDLFNFV